jgi:hypothetical protein
VGSPETLKGKDKVYAATHRFILKEGDWRGAYRVDRLLGEVPVPLVPTLTGDGPTIVLAPAEDVEADPRRVELRIRLDQWVKGDEVRVTWDGEELTGPVTEYCTMGDPAGISDVSSAAWLRFPLTAEAIASGGHQVKVSLVERHPRLACDLVLTDVELVVAYEKESS